LDFRIKELYLSGMSLQAVADEVGFCRQYVQKRAQAWGCIRPSTAWTADPDKVAASRRKFSLRRKGKPQPSKRKYALRDDFFSNISTEEQAYILGFFQTDGTLPCDKYRIKFTLASYDKDILEKMGKTVFTGAFRIGTINGGRHCVLEMNSIQMTQDLTDMGFHSNKTYDSPFLELEPSLMRHYLRGLIDGDGSVSLASIGTRVDFCGASLPVVEGMTRGFQKAVRRESSTRTTTTSTRFVCAGITQSSSFITSTMALPYTLIVSTVCTKSPPASVLPRTVM
jgi:hypothetical protein